MEVCGLDDTNLVSDRATEGGVDFMRGDVAQTDRAIWASNSNIIKRIADEAEAARKAAAGVGLSGGIMKAQWLLTQTTWLIARICDGIHGLSHSTVKQRHHLMTLCASLMRRLASDPPKLREWVDNKNIAKA